MDKRKVLVVGCGSIGLRHLQNLLLSGDISAAALDPRPEAGVEVDRISKSIGFFSDPAAAEAWQPELVIVATPNHLHKDGCLRAFAAGAHVLCEKPLADTVANGRIMVDAAAAAGKILAVGFTERYREAVQYMISEIKAGRIGTVIGGRAMVGTYNTLLCAKNPEDRAKTFGNVIIDYVHELDILAEIFGHPERLECFANNLAVKERKADPSLAEILIEYRSGAVVSVHMDYVQHPQRRIIEIYGDKKTFCYNFHFDSLEIYDCDKPGVEIRTFNNVRNEQFLREHEDVLSAIATGNRPRVSGEDALKSLEIAETAINRLKEQVRQKT